MSDTVPSQLGEYLAQLENRMVQSNDISGIEEAIIESETALSTYQNLKGMDSLFGNGDLNSFQSEFKVAYDAEKESLGIGGSSFAKNLGVAVSTLKESGVAENLNGVKAASAILKSFQTDSNFLTSGEMFFADFKDGFDTAQQEVQPSFGDEMNGHDQVMNGTSGHHVNDSYAKATNASFQERLERIAAKQSEGPGIAAQ